MTCGRVGWIAHVVLIILSTSQCSRATYTEGLTIIFETTIGKARLLMWQRRTMRAILTYTHQQQLYWPLATYHLLIYACWLNILSTAEHL
ncbi:hypothetical protein F4777DRAFT_562798, partial [Nemania sp. FL0916]